MVIKDLVYGSVGIKEPVLLELMKTPALLRLRQISQYGLPDDYYHLKGYSRYEHSVGVMLLLQRQGANLEEQVAGLLHDVSHLAFSHLADWVFAQGQKGVEDHQDNIHSGFVLKTELPAILKKYGFSLKRVLNEDNFSILENLLPDLCADRVDYALREFYHWLNPKIVWPCLSALTVYKKEIVFDKVEPALVFAVNYMDLQTRHWGGYEAMMRYHLFSSLLKTALDKKIINKKDFYGVERPIINKLVQSGDKKINRLMDILNRKKLPLVKPVFGKRIYKKFRYVDPKVLANGEPVRLSRLKSKYLKVIAHHKKINQQGLLV